MSYKKAFTNPFGRRESCDFVNFQAMTINYWSYDFERTNKRFDAFIAKFREHDLR